MRTAGGVLILCAALLNVFGGLGRLGVGAFTTVRGLAGGESGKAVEKAGETGDPGALRRAGEKMEAGGGGLMGLGLMTIVVACLQVTAAVLLFTSRGRALVLTTAALGVLVAGLAFWITGIGWTDAFGAAASIVAGVGAAGMQPAAPAPAAPA